MKHLYSLALAMLLLPLVATAQTVPDDRYMAIYDLIQQADSLNDGTTTQDALAKYREAQQALTRFQGEFPGWNAKIVKFRLNYLATKIAPLEAKSSPAGTAEPAPGSMPAPVIARTESGGQVAALQAQLRRTQAEKADLEKQIKDLAAGAPPAGTEAQSLAEAQEKIKTLLQENEQLRTSLKQTAASPPSSRETALLDRASQTFAEAKAKLAEQAQQLATLNEQNQSLQKRLTAVTADAAGSSQVATLQQDLRRAEADRLALQAQLKDMQARAAGNTEQVTQLDEKIKTLQKENSLLRASLEQRQVQTIPTRDSFTAEQSRQALADLNQKLQEQTGQIARLTSERDGLQQQLDAVVKADPKAKELVDARQALKKLQRRYDILDEAAIVVITEHKLKLRQQGKAAERMTRELEDLKKQSAGGRANAELIAMLREENDILKKRIAEIEKDAAKSMEPGRELLEAQAQVATLRAQIAVLEARTIPYTTEELALFKQPEISAANPADKKPAPALPSSAAELVVEAKRLFAAHRLQEAEEKYQQVLKLAPDNIFVLGNLATIQIERENFADAEKNLRKAMTLDPKDAFSLGVWGNLLFRAAKYDDAFQALSRAAELDPNSAEIQNLLGITLSHKGQRGAAETALRKALQLDPNFGNAHNNLAVIYITQEPPLTELARWHYQKALALGVNRNAELEKLLEPSPADKSK